MKITNNFNSPNFGRIKMSEKNRTETKEAVRNLILGAKGKRSAYLQNVTDFKKGFDQINRQTGDDLWEYSAKKDTDGVYCPLGVTLTIKKVNNEDEETFNFSSHIGDKLKVYNISDVFQKFTEFLDEKNADEIVSVGDKILNSFFNETR